MIDQDIDYAVFSTCRKVGAGETNYFYDPKTGRATKGEFKGINNIRYSIVGIQAEVPSKDELGAAAGIPVGTAAIAVLELGEAKELMKDISEKE